MSKENKGMIEFPNKKDWQYVFRTDCNWEHDCFSFGCDGEGICRCGTIVNARVEPPGVSGALSLVKQYFVKGTGAEGNFGMALAMRFFRCAFTDASRMFEVKTCGGYYGDEIESVQAKDNHAWKIFYARLDAFNNGSNSERLKLVLNMEYGLVLPEVDKWEEWQLIEVPTEKVKADKGVLARVNERIVAEYELLTPWVKFGSFSKDIRGFSPAVVAIPKQGGLYRVIDGFHRYMSWTVKPRGMDSKKWKKLRRNKKMKIITPVV